MIRRRRLLQASASLLAAPAIVQRAGAAGAFDWKQFKGQKIEVNFQKSPRADVLVRHQAEFEELTGIKVGFEQIPEQQQRPKVAVEMASGRPSFDVVNVALHVQKRLIEKADWMEDLRPYVANPTLTVPDLDMGDFSAAGMRAATGPTGKLNVLPMNQDVFILFYNRPCAAAMRTESSVQAFGRSSARSMKAWPRRDTSAANTPIWQFVILPAEPVYCRPTPQDARPCLRKPVSSITGTASSAARGSTT